MRGLLLLSSVVLSAMPIAAQAQATSSNAGPGNADAALAKQLSNPVASLISVPLQFNLDSGGGVNDNALKFTLNIQPVVPVSISSDANVIVRTIVPIVYQDDLSRPGASEFGLGDTVQSFFYSPKMATKGGITWGVGPVFLYPTGTSQFIGGEKWGAGPTFVVLKQSGQSTIGVLANHIWSFAGDDSRSDISATFIQPFFSYTTKRATTFSLNTESTYNWKTKKWIVPINVGVAQLLKVGKQPVSWGSAADTMLRAPREDPIGVPASR